MDWIRYAESHGSEGDPKIPGASVYRDYLIRALNADVPYDQLVREHIAGDLLPIRARIRTSKLMNRLSTGALAHGVSRLRPDRCARRKSAFHG